MKRPILCVIGAAVLTVFSVTGGSASDSEKLGVLASGAGKRTIGVIGHSDFLPDRTGTNKKSLIGLPDSLADRIVQHLANSKRFVVVERTALRRVVLEQRFGKRLRKSYLDRTLGKAIEDMEEVSAANVAVTGALADRNDVLKDFLDLGTAIGADYLVLGRLEKLARKTKETAVPYSTEGRTFRQDVVDARLYLRVIEVRSGTLAGATSFRTKVKETVFEGKESDTDEYSFYDHLGRLASLKVLDAIFPARIASTAPLVVTRGTIEGVKTGDIYIIEREGKEIKDQTGIIIGTVRDRVGKVRVVRAQETLSIVEPLAGSGFAEGDRAFLDVEAAETVVAEAPRSVPLVRPEAPPMAARKALPRIAIGLIKSKSTASTEPEKAIDIFTDTLISRLAQTKRFRMADRQEVGQLLKEQQLEALREGKDLPSAVGTLKAVDYLVYGNLALFEVQEKQQQLPGSSRLLPSRKIGRVEGNMRVVDTRTGDIVESRKISVEEELDPEASGDRLIDILADAYAGKAVALLMNAIYPIKVAAIGQDGVVYINRGSDGGLASGQMLEAFRPGQAVTDPDTGVRLGFTELPLGRVIVNEVEDSRSKGVVASGGKLQRGDILKRRTVATPKSVPPRRSGPTLPGALAKQATKPRQGGKFILALGTLGVSPNIQTDLAVEDLVERASSDLVVKLTNTNRFVLMERAQVDQILEEKEFETTVKQGKFRERLKELEGADYLVLGEFASFYVSAQRGRVAYLDEVAERLTAVAEGTFRITDVHTGSIAAAEKIQISERIKSSADRNLAMSNLLDRFTSEAVSRIVMRLFPVKLLGLAADGTAFINRGADGRIILGARYDVMRPGEVLRDRDTGIAFGRSEVRVGQVEIIAVEPSRSRARLLSGDNLRAGDILREPLKPAASVQPQVLKPKW